MTDLNGASVVAIALVRSGAPVLWIDRRLSLHG